MEDSEILALYKERDETAIDATRHKYGGYCHTIAYNLLQNIQDSEECTGDTWLHAWNAIPPAFPLHLAAWLGRVTRNLALDIYRRKSARKRDGGLPLVLDELSDCLPAPGTPEEDFDAKGTARLINAFLQGCTEENRRLFLRRYWYGDSLEDAARFCSLRVSVAKARLFRMRAQLKTQLEKEGVTV